MTLWLNKTINSSSLSGLFHSIKYLSNISQTYPRSHSGESGRASHVDKLRTSNRASQFDKQIARCNNYQIKILNLFEFPHVLAA